MVRFKNRWLLLSLDTRPFDPSTTSPDLPSHPSLTPQALTKLLRSSLSTNFGDVASGTFGGSLVCKYYSTHTGTAIVRCAREGAKNVWASATLVTTTSLDGANNGLPLRVRVTHLGGTIKKLQRRAIELDKARILQLKAEREKRKIPAATAAAVAEDETTRLLEASRKAISAVS